MKKVLSIVSILIIMCVSLTGCSSKGRTVKINGKKYKNSFYPSYIWVNKYEKDGDPIKVGLFKYQKVVNNNFELYQTDALINKTEGEIYCLEEQWENAYNYYHDSNNYYYRYGYDNYVPKDEESYMITNIEFEKFDILANGGNNDSLNWQEFIKNASNKLELSYEQRSKGKIVWLQGYTTDELFATALQELLIYENKLYYFIGMDGNYDAKTGIDGEDVYYYIPVPDEVNEYFLKLIM